MAKARILYVNQEIVPYVADSYLANLGRYMPQGIQERGKEIRTFMPRFGTINERKNQLHEVIRLSGLNLVINNADHQLIIKVASIQAARMQIYFIDNDDYFQRKADVVDGNGVFFEDNDERAMFYAKGVIETVKKLGWQPHIVHCTGWFTGMLPFYLKRAYKDDPLYTDTKVVITLFADEFQEELADTVAKKLKLDGGTPKDVKLYQEPLSYVNYMKAAISYSAGVVLGDENVNPELIEFAKKNKKPILEYSSNGILENLDKMNAFYDSIIGKIEE
ncbi:glycogen/starch synthase [Bacteroidales bacterium OttesenSCG-928-C19]|nr:glycogen/starch synthase [Bacteroidales bacterium OttesenSCG-928-C19]